MHRMSWTAVPLVALAWATPAHGHDLRGRIGVGAEGGVAPVPALSVRYALPTSSPLVDVQLQLVAGASVLSGASDLWFVGGRVLYGMVIEDQLNGYVAAGLGTGQEGGTAFLRVQPAAGVEFFLFGLENLGFSAEVGLNVDLSPTPAVFTFGGVPAVGIHYWF